MAAKATTHSDGVTLQQRNGAGAPALSHSLVRMGHAKGSFVLAWLHFENGSPTKNQDHRRQAIVSHTP